MAATRFWAVIPAAGASRRMGQSSSPKQYLPIEGRTVIEWSLRPFLDRADVSGVVVVLAKDDAWWRELPIAHETRVLTAMGGVERVHSVLAGLAVLSERASEDDWVLVHDAARPCLSKQDLEQLILRLHDDPVGGLLAAPLVDTVKRADSSDHVEATQPRDLLWRAFTPQMFRLGLLRRALTRAVESNLAVTDESQAIEALKLRPKLIHGDPDNIKITVPGDLERAARILRARRAA